MIAWLIFGSAPMLSPALGYIFLPSTEWVSKTGSVALAIGWATAIWSLWIICITADRAPGSDLKKISAIIFFPLLSYWAGSTVVVIVGPMVLALAAGHEVELTFTVESAGRYGSRRCRTPLELQDLPLLFGRVCGVSSDFTEGLAPGTRIAASGHGTSLGVFVRGLHRLD